MLRETLQLAPGQVRRFEHLEVTAGKLVWVVPDDAFECSLDDDGVIGLAAGTTGSLHELQPTRAVLATHGLQVQRSVNGHQCSRRRVLVHHARVGEHRQVWRMAILEFVGKYRGSVAGAGVVDPDTVVRFDLEPVDHRQESVLFCACPGTKYCHRRLSIGRAAAPAQPAGSQQHDHDEQDHESFAAHLSTPGIRRDGV